MRLVGVMSGVHKKKISKIDILIYGSLILIPFLFFSPIFIADININVGDGIGYEIMLNFFRQVCLKGEVPLWNKYVALGTSFVGDVQNKVFYPLTWLCAFLPEKIAFKFFYVIHISLANVFMYCLCKVIDCDKYVCFFSAFMFSFSNLIIIRYEHMNILCCLVWIPLIFAFLIKFYKSSRKEYIIFTALAMGMQFMAGFPQTAFYSDLFVFISMFYLNYRFKKSIKSYFIDAIILGFFYLGICMIQILPLLEIMRFSGRGTITFEYFSDGAADWRQIFNLLTPTATGHFGSLLPGTHEFPTDTYLGIIPVTLIVFAIVYLYKNIDIIFLFMYSLFAMIFACACNNIPFLGKIIYATPVFGSFRTTTRMLAFFVIPLLFISVICLREIVKKKLWTKYFKVTMCLFGFMLITYVSVRLFGGNSQNDVITFYYENHAGLNSVVLLGILNAILMMKLKVFNMKSMKLLIAIGATFFQVVDVYFYNTDLSADFWRMPNLLSARTYEETFDSDIKNALQELDEDRKERFFINFYTWEELADTSWSIRPNGNMRSELPMIQSYITFNNPQLLALANTTYGMMMNINDLKATTNPSLLSFLNIGYVISRKEDQRFMEEYEYDGIIYEEYEGRQCEDNEALLVGNAKPDSYITINIDAEVAGEDSVVALYEGSEKIANIGVLSQNVRYYVYYYTPQSEHNSLKLVFENGSNTKINGIRIESYKLIANPLLDMVYADGVFSLYKNSDNRGRVFIFENVNIIDDVEKFIVDQKADINFTRDAYLDKEDISDTSLAGCEGSVVSIIETSNKVMAEIEINSDKALLGFSESFYPGWEVYVDGKKQDLIMVDALIQGVFVSNGKHEVEFRYQPVSVYIGGVLSVITIILMYLYKKFAVKVS